MIDLQWLVGTVSSDLREDEGFERFPYRDPKKGKLTIGYGRNLEDVGINVNEANMLLSSDVSNAAAEVFKQFPWVGNLPFNRVRALVNMCFNMGMGTLLEFKKMLACLEAGDIAGTVAEMKSSDWYREIPTRAERVITLMEEG